MRNARTLSFTEIPLGLTGQVFGSAMPCGLYAPNGHLFRRLKRSTVSAVVLLAEIDEWRENTGQDLVALYEQGGMAVPSLPIPNYGLPPYGRLAPVLDDTIKRATLGQSILIH